MEVSDVRKRMMAAMERARARATARRQRAAEAEQAYATFLDTVAAPVAHQVAGVLKAEKYPFTVFTPSGALRVASDRGRDDFVEIALDRSGDVPEVVAHVRYTRGSRTVDASTPIKPGAAPDAITEQDVLELFATALEPWLER